MSESETVLVPLAMNRRYLEVVQHDTSERISESKHLINNGSKDPRPLLHIGRRGEVVDKPAEEGIRGGRSKVYKHTFEEKQSWECWRE